MKKKIILALFALCSLYGAAAQKETFSTWKFHSINQLGLLQGESTAAVHLQSVNGFEKKNWFAGIGAALDYYKYKSVPLFAEGRKYFGKTKNQFFLYTGAGINFVWEKTNQSSFYAEKHTPGLYAGAGMGYKAGFKNGMALLLSGGYSYKRVNDRQAFQPPCFSPGPCNLQIENYKYDLNRLLLQVGWMF